LLPETSLFLNQKPINSLLISADSAGNRPPHLSKPGKPQQLIKSADGQVGNAGILPANAAESSVTAIHFLTS
jgi:hypothetical protein